MPSISAARFASSTRSISTAIQDSMWEALSPWAIRCDRLGIAAVSPLEMPRCEGTRATLTSSPLSRLRVTTNSGCITRWMGAFCRTSSALTESTRKGMSSVTM